MCPAPDRSRSVRLASLGLALAALAGGAVRAQGTSTAGAPPHSALAGALRENVLVLIADDLGVEQLACYGEGVDPAVTPVIDALAAEGVLFRNAWSQPVCSPTRAGIVTGRHGFRTGIGHIVTTSSYALPLSEVTLPELLTQEQPGYRHALIGKWHLGNDLVGGPLSPELAGWSKFDGSLFSFEPAPLAYDHWPRIIDGVQRISTRYATSAHVDAALKWIAANEDGPWVLFLAFDAPHAPYHDPPAGLYYEDLTGVPASELRPRYKAMIESMDTEIGRLLDGIETLATAPPVVVFVGDNGTPNEVTSPPVVFGKAKNSVYEGGLNVPLIVSGRRGAPRGAECARLVHTADLFATVAELAGIDARAALPEVTLDARSFLSLVDDPNSPPVHQHVYAESFQPIGLPPPPGSHVRAIRDGRYKLIRRPTGEEFYDLLTDPLEDHELLAAGLTEAQAAAYQELSEAVASYLPGSGGGGG